LFTTPPQPERGGFWKISAIQFRADSQELFLATGSGEVFRFDARTGREKQKFVADYRNPQQIQAGKPKQPSHGASVFSIDAKTLVTSSADWIHVWDVDTGSLRLQIGHHGCNVSLAPDGKTLATSDIRYAGDLGTDAIRMYDIDTGDELLTLESDGNRASVMAFSPDGKRLFTGFHRGSAIVWDVSR
jgi:WD40 repeat protein